MNKLLTHFALAVLLTVGLMGCAADRTSSYTTEPMRPVFQSQLPVIEGQVVRNEGNAYVIRELSGRQTRVAFDRKTEKDNIVVGDTVAARFDGLPSSAYATSITRGTGKPTPPANTSPRFQTVEGIVQQQDGTDYVMKENSGRDMRLRVDNTTRFDRNITGGDKVMAITNPVPSDAPYVTTMYRLDSPHLVQGEVVWTDENGYVVRDFTGRDIRLQSNSATVRNDIIRVGDRIIADTGSSSSVHVDSIAKQ